MRVGVVLAARARVVDGIEAAGGRVSRNAGGTLKTSWDTEHLLLINILVHARHNHAVSTVPHVAGNASHTRAVGAAEQGNELRREPVSKGQAIIAVGLGRALLAEVATVELRGGHLGAEFGGDAVHDTVDTPDLSRFMVRIPHFQCFGLGGEA